MDVPQTPELRGKSTKCFSAVNRTHMKAEKVFHTQDPTINWRSHVQVPASVTALTGPGHKTGPNNYLSLPGAHPRPPLCVPKRCTPHRLQRVSGTAHLGRAQHLCLLPICIPSAQYQLWLQNYSMPEGLSKPSGPLLPDRHPQPPCSVPPLLAKGPASEVGEPHP